jgi:hypothetical protein
MGQGNFSSCEAGRLEAFKQGFILSNAKKIDETFK